MAGNPFAASLQAPGGYVLPPAPKPIAPPAFNLPSLPALPPINDSRAPNALGRELLTKQLTNLPGRYNPMFSNIRGQAQEALAGYGGWTFQDDDPATPEREDLAVPTKDLSKGLGAREQQAVLAQRAGAAGRGILDSSFANKAVGAALGQLNEEAKGIVRQYAAGIGGIIENQRQETTDIITDIVGLYGEDARWLADNPPPRFDPFIALPAVPGVTTPYVAPPPPDLPAGYEYHGGGTASENLPALGPLNRDVPGMRSPSWKQDPGLSIKATEARFGKGARIKKVGGKNQWVVRKPGGGRY